MSGSRGAPARGSVSPARRVALEVVAAVRERDAYANLLLRALLRRERLPAEEAAFATELAYGSLRRLGHYDAVIQAASGRAIEAVDPRALDVLRIAAHQLLALRTAPHAAVHQAVEQARASAGEGAARFVNAVLRRIGERDDAAWTARLAEGLTDPAERLGALCAHPAWVVRELDEALARSAAAGTLDALLAADDLAPAVALAALPGLADPVETGLPPHALSPIGVVLLGGDPAGVSGVREGRVRVQDAGSQLAALALTRARPTSAGERWLDLCSGPGGKAAVLAAEAHAGGAALVANEVAPARSRLVAAALAPVPGDHRVVTGDGRRFVSGADRFDRVLLDAPCTGLGALRRRPEARWRKQPGDVPPLAALQAGLLDAAVGALAPGGLLAYVTCSPVTAETEDVVDGALARHPGLLPLDTADVLDAVTAGRIQRHRRGTAVQLWPHLHDSDGMFMQLLTTR